MFSDEKLFIVDSALQNDLIIALDICYANTISGWIQGPYKEISMPSALLKFFALVILVDWLMELNLEMLLRRSISDLHGNCFSNEIFSC